MKNLRTIGLAVLATLLLQGAAFAKEVTVTANDTMQFNVTELSVKAGEELVVTFKNAGTLPKQAMGHNFVVLKQGGDVATVGNAAISAASHDYIPQEGPAAELILTHTKLLGPGESDQLSVTFDKPGVYPYLCSFPGHWALMRGTITVE